MVNIAGSLPKGEANGLAAHARELAQALTNGRKYFVVGVVGTDSVKTKQADLEPVPTVAFTRLELVPFNDELEDPARALMQALADQRMGVAGQQRFSFGTDAEATPAGPAEFEAGGGMFFRVVDSEPGRFDLLLCSQYVDGVLSRSGLVREQFGEIPPGEYQLAQLDGEVLGLAQRLLTEWETNGGEAVVDAEIVEDEVEDAAEEAADDEDGEEE